MRFVFEHIKKLIFILLILTAKESFPQVVDTVCPSYPYGNYGVVGIPNSFFQWQVNGGQIISTNGNDSIEVKWDFSSSILKLSVVETTISGCIGDTVVGYVQKSEDPDVEINGKDSSCINGKTLLSAQGATNYHWSTGENSIAISPLISSDTSFTLAGFDGCGYDTATINIVAVLPPNASFYIKPQKVVEYEEASFNYNGNGGTSFQWFVDNFAINDDNYKVYHRFQQAGNYKVLLYVENDFKCYDTTSQSLIVHTSSTNSFTPNGDGVNDFWILHELDDFPNCQIWIYDRSGGQVFYSQGYTQPWDGKRNGEDLPEGTYYFVIDYGIGGNRTKGTITILR